VRTRRGATDLSGILAIDKPAGMTSHDVVGRVRQATGERRVGHAGTLDPMATGLLVVLVGPATRLAPYLTSAEKTYEARIVFGAETNTDDAEGEVTRTAHVPDEIGDPFFARGTIAALVGTHEQVPPAFSAIKRGGVTAYAAARKGEALKLEPRLIRIDSATLLGVDCQDGCVWDVEFSVSKGTYIRALARDLGCALDTAAHLGALRRTRSGALTLADARTLDDVEAASDVRTLFADPLAALGLPIARVDAESAARVATGAVISAAAATLSPLPVAAEPHTEEEPQFVAVEHDGALLGVYAAEGRQLTPQTVIPGAVAKGV
jgi:tRNA pseudouridine55 synthase